MATIYNSDLSKELQEGGRLSVRDKMPNELADKVVPVMEVNPKVLRRINWNFAGAATNATSTSLGTISSTKDTYIVAASMSLSKDVTAVTTFVRLNAVMENGQTVVLCPIGCLTLTAETHDMAVSFPFPIKLKKGTSITVTASSATGNFNVFASAVGYEVDNPSA